MPVWIPILCLVAAGVGLFIGEFNRRRSMAMSGTATIGCGAVAGQPASTQCEVKGMTAPGPRGLYTAELSGRPCVWYHAEVSEHWEEHHTDSEGHHHVDQRSRRLHTSAAPGPFGLADSTGQVLVRMDGHAIDHCEQSVHREEPAERGMKDFAIDLLTDKHNHRIRYVEYLVEPGRHLYVLAAHLPDGGAPTLGKVNGTTMLVSTRTEEQLQRGAGRMFLVGYILAGAGVIGAALTGLFAANIL